LHQSVIAINSSKEIKSCRNWLDIRPLSLNRLQRFHESGAFFYGIQPWIHIRQLADSGSTPDPATQTAERGIRIADGLLFADKRVSF
jgi:hypothetical protein